MKVLLLTPRLYHTGGVAHYCNTVLKYARVDYLVQQRGAKGDGGKLTKYVTTALDYISFFLKLLLQRPALIHQNTSLGAGGVKRDAGFIRIAQAFNVPILLFMRGWDPSYEKLVDADPDHIFRKLFLNVDRVAVLNTQVAEKIQEWGYKGSVIQETTVVDDDLVKSVSSEAHSREKLNLLFMSRLERSKGLQEMLDGIAKVKDEIPLHLNIAGDGSARQMVVDLISKLGLSGHVTLRGVVSGETKSRLMSESDAFMLPSHTEGLPNSMLECMAVGMPVLVTAVGGIPDLFEDGKMGVLMPKPSAEEVSNAVRTIWNKGSEGRNEIGSYNASFARERFLASNVTVRLAEIYSDMLKEKTA